MFRSYQYRLYPTKAQVTRLTDTLSLCCELYNAGLQERRDAWRLCRKTILYREQRDQLPEIKALRPELSSVHAQVLQDVLMRLDKAFRLFFERCRATRAQGYPRFRSVSRYRSFTYPQSGFSFKDCRLALSKVGNIKILLHRPIPGRVKTLTISRSATGKWFAAFSVEMPPTTVHAGEARIGIDLGLTSFATLSTGEKVPIPRFFRTDEKELSKVQRLKKWKAARRIHERIASRRRNFAHQVSRALVSTCGFIALETLNIRGMSSNSKLAKSIFDAAWNQFVRFTTYKAESAGAVVCLVDPRNTSKQCSACGSLVAKGLNERIHRCGCGLVLDRDHNAAINILSLGLQAHGHRSNKAALLSCESGVATTALCRD